MARYLSPVVGVRPAGIEPRAAGDRRAVELAVRLAIAGALAYQVFQRVVNNGYELSPYGRSLWYVTYQFGFVRRGLAGELLRRALGRSPTIPEVAFAQNVIAVATVAAGVWLVWLLCKRRTAIAYAVAALMAVSPFGFDFVGGSRRPDLVAFLLLALVAVWVARGAREPVVVGLVAGVLLAVTVLFSEAGPLVVGPWVALVVAAHARSLGRSRWECRVATGAAVVPSVVMLAAVAATGQASPERVTSLEFAAPIGVDGQGTVFPYLDDTLGDSIGKVVHHFPVTSLVVGAFLLVLLAVLARRLAPYARATADWVLVTRGERAWWVVGTAAGVGLLFGLGFDWMRWITSIVFAASLAAAAIVVLVHRADAASRPAWPDDWARPVPSRVSLSLPAVGALAVAVYLLVLPPLPTAVQGLGGAAHLLMNAPG